MPDPRLPLPAGFDPLKHFGHLLHQVEKLHPGMQVESLQDGFAQLSATPSRRPHAVKLQLKPGSTARDIPAMAEFVARKDLTLVEVRLQERFAVAAKLLPANTYALSQLAKSFGCAPFEIDAQISWHTTDDGGIRADEVVLFHAPQLGYSREDREKRMLAAVSYLPGGHDGWTVKTDHHGTTTLKYRVKRALPKTVKMEDVLPERYAPDEWMFIALGRGPERQRVGLALEASPHALLCGPVGSGKTIGLVQHMASALACGHKVLLLDAMKSGVDFASLKPYLSGLATNVEEVDEALQQVYAEGQRRKVLLVEHGVGSWAALPSEVREREDVVPLSIYIDEFTSTVIPEVVPALLPRDDPDREASEAANLHRAKIQSVAGKIARELRYVGCFLVIATQRPDTATGLDGNFRSQLTGAVQLRAPGRPLALETARMTLGPDAQRGNDLLAELDDGHSRGLAVSVVEGGDLDAFRVGFAPMDRIPTLLEERGVPLPSDTWDFTPKLKEPEFTYVRRPAPKSTSAATTVAEASFSLDELEAWADDDARPKFVVPEGL